MIQINVSSSIPLYTQLIYEIKKNIVVSDSVQVMPSVRQLASDIGVNLHTVNKAYKQLEKDGVLVKTTKGFQSKPLDDITIPSHVMIEFKEKYRELLVDADIYKLSKMDLTRIKEQLQHELIDGGDA
ncbi:MAG: GntR family transcriptional regulator [Vagococcus sp.]